MLRAEQRASIERSFVLSDAITTRIFYFFSDPKTRDAKDVLQIDEAYPELFADVRERRLQQEAIREIEDVRASRIAFANRWNSRFEEMSDESGTPQTDSVD